MPPPRQLPVPRLACNAQSPSGWPAARSPRAAAGLPTRLEVALRSAGQSLVLADFALAELELDSALALVEHLAEGAQE